MGRLGKGLGSRGEVTRVEHRLAEERSESSGEAELAFGERCWLEETRGYGLRLLQWARNRDCQCRCLAGFSMGFFFKLHAISGHRGDSLCLVILQAGLWL